MRRIPAKGWLGGVCAGFAYYFSVPVWAVRLAWTLAIFAGMGFGLLFYILFWIFMPKIEAPSDYSEATE
ncbi:MAG: Phage shock protein C [Candidatus Wolfebacteria bacterium GW2011_GWC1_37_10]|uniref:Phage shock protein C n=1 Tax=Candidatus Wolfebacteria bacterium GW2011_GWC1_37_10 TaxID=1619010 RepID=A0A0G0FVA1_9BACT|nr:MAG: Phage shock protein C [Candidatus Wolfebacteria bacterium GW2011_GWC1_37_10]